VLISIFKTSLEVPPVILQLFLCWVTEERQDGEEKTLGKAIKLKFISKNGGGVARKME